MRHRCPSCRVIVLLVPFIAPLAGCYHNRISLPDKWAPATEVHRKTVWSFFWGAEQQNIYPNECQGEGLAEVTVSRNFGDLVISVLSLGMASPVTIEWTCSKCSQEVGDDF